MIPAEFRARMDNVQIVIEDEPDPSLLDEMGIPEGDTLYGLYTGTPLTERTSDYAGFPDEIIIYRLPLTEDFDDPADLRRQVARTVIHEVAHHFGISDEHLTALGWD